MAVAGYSAVVHQLATVAVVVVVVVVVLDLSKFVLGQAFVLAVVELDHDQHCYLNINQCLSPR